MITDRFEKVIHLNAPRSRVWGALTDPLEFGAWFGAELHGAFVPGESISGHITIPGFEHVTLTMLVERVEPQNVFSFRWHPYAIEPGVDYSAEPTTLVEFVLEQTHDGTRLQVSESGFDSIPLARRGEAFRMNQKGWAAQLTNIKKHVA